MKLELLSNPHFDDENHIVCLFYLFGIVKQKNHVMRENGKFHSKIALVFLSLCEAPHYKMIIKWFSTYQSKR